MRNVCYADGYPVYGDAALVCRKRRARGHYRINLQGDFQTAGAFTGKAPGASVFNKAVHIS